MPVRDLDARLNAVDPVADVDLSRDLARTRRRVLADLDRPSTLPRRRRLLAASAAAAAAAAIFAVTAILPATREKPANPLQAALPAPVQAFAAELTGDGILHVVTEHSAVINGRGRERASLPRTRTEGWYALDGSRSRSRLTSDGSDVVAETVFDGRCARTVNSRRGLIQAFDVSPGRRGQMFGGWLLTLRRALAEGDADISGQATVRGRPAYDVALDRAPGDDYPTDMHVFVAREDHALLRIERLRLPFPKDRDANYWDVEREEVLTYQVLPATDQNQRLLELTPQLRDMARGQTPSEVDPSGRVGGCSR